MNKPAPKLYIVIQADRYKVEPKPLNKIQAKIQAMTYAEKLPNAVFVLAEVKAYYQGKEIISHE